MSKALLSKSYPQETKRIKSAPNVIVNPPQKLSTENIPINSTPIAKTQSDEILEMLQNPTSISVTRNTNITLKALGSLGYGDTIDQTIEILINSFLDSFTVDEQKTLQSLQDSFQTFETINFEKKKKNKKRGK